MPPWLFVTPSSRGIGFALTRHLLKTTDSSVPLVAAARTKDADGLKERLLDGLFEKDQSGERGKAGKRLDLRGGVNFDDEKTIEDVAAYCKDRYNNLDNDANAHLRLAFCIPGILHPERSPSQIDAEQALQTLKTNLLAPMLLSKHFTPFLPQKSLSLTDLSGLPPTSIFALMSARVGSITDNSLGGWFSYRASKAGVNQLAKTLDLQLRRSSGMNAAVVALHPGTVKTGLSEEFWGSTKPEKLFSPEFAAEKLVEVVNGLGMRVKEGGKEERDQRVGGRCWDWKGEEIQP